MLLILDAKTASDTFDELCFTTEKDYYYFTRFLALTAQFHASAFEEPEYCGRRINYEPS